MTLAALKRRLTLGTKLNLVRHDYSGFIGSAERTVAKVQTNLIAFAVPGKSSLTWLEWKKAKDYRIDDQGFDVALNPGDFDKLMRYEFA